MEAVHVWLVLLARNGKPASRTEGSCSQQPLFSSFLFLSLVLSPYVFDRRRHSKAAHSAGTAHKICSKREKSPKFRYKNNRQVVIWTGVPRRAAGSMIVIPTTASNYSPFLHERSSSAHSFGGNISKGNNIQKFITTTAELPRCATTTTPKLRSV